MALLMIPEIDDTVKNTKYTGDAIRHAISQGYLPVTNSLHPAYKLIETREFANQVIQSCTAVFLFTDFGVTELMAETAERAIKEEKKIIYVKLGEKNPQEYDITPEDILEEVSSKTKISIDDLRSKTRKREVVDARYMYYRRCREYFKQKCSYREIGEEVNRDHASVIWGIRATEEIIEVKRKYDSYYGTKAGQ